LETALEKVLMNFFKKEMIEYLNSHPEDFNQAITLALTNKQPYSWRAAWLLWSCIEQNDKRLIPFKNDLIAALKGKADGHQREILKLISVLELNDIEEGFIFNECLSIWESINKRPSVRFTAIKFALKIAAKYPDLLNEIDFFTQNHYTETLSPGIKQAVYRLTGKNQE